MEAAYNIRSIAQDDNTGIARIIRACLKEFGADKPGTVYYDESTDRLYELFGEKGSAYFIAEHNGTMLGGGGIFPSAGLPEGTCELVKMYLLPQSRGKGIGAALMNRCLDATKYMGFNTVYIETLTELDRAIAVYEKFGFKNLRGPLGDTGHFGCDVWMTKPL
jgi:putative acetyltransferase